MNNRGAPAKIWIDVLRRITPILTELHVTDMILFGSQAMSAYMERALASKDIDLIAPGVGPNILEKTRDELEQVAAQTPTYDHSVGEYGKDISGQPHLPQTLERLPIRHRIFREFSRLRIEAAQPFPYIEEQMGTGVAGSPTRGNNRNQTRVPSTRKGKPIQRFKTEPIHQTHPSRRLEDSECLHRRI